MPSEQRTVTWPEFQRQREGSQRLGPGVWVDADGGLHFSMPELLEFMNVADTPENRRKLLEIVREQAQLANPDAVVVEQELES